jgi:hypothetical protein
VRLPWRHRFRAVEWRSHDRTRSSPSEPTVCARWVGSSRSDILIIFLFANCQHPLSARTRWPVITFLTKTGVSYHRMLWREFIEELTLIAVAAAAGAGMFLVITLLIPLF